MSLRKAAWVGLPFLVALLFGCPAPYAPKEAATTPDPGTGGSSEQHDDLFVQQPDQSWLFSTNDSAFWGPNGYTLWALPLAGQPAFAQRDVDLVKSSGNAWAGYGIVFCQFDTGDPAIGESMLLVMINTQQQYSVGEVNDSRYTPYSSTTWVSHAAMNRGYGVVNRVTVTRDAGGLFTLYLNGVQVMTFRDGRSPAPNGGGDGYLAVISPQDSFPQTPVTVSYKEN
jgi:hypothetical protein